MSVNSILLPLSSCSFRYFFLSFLIGWVRRFWSLSRGSAIANKILTPIHISQSLAALQVYEIFLFSFFCSSCSSPYTSCSCSSCSCSSCSCSCSSCSCSSCSCSSCSCSFSSFSFFFFFFFSSSLSLSLSLSLLFYYFLFLFLLFIPLLSFFCFFPLYPSFFLSEYILIDIIIFLLNWSPYL